MAMVKIEQVICIAIIEHLFFFQMSEVNYYNTTMFLKDTTPNQHLKEK